MKVLLLGGGHANIQVLKALAKLQNRHFTVTLISDVRFAPYSGMVPSFLAGVYKKSQLHFDLQKICERSQFEFILDEVTAISQNSVQLKTSKPLEFDICSVNLGIKPVALPAHSDQNLIYLKPISQLLDQFERLDAEKKDFHLNIVGGGSAGFEIAIACRRRFPFYHITLVTGRHGLLSEQNLKTRRLARESLQQARILVLENKSVLQIQDGHLILEDHSEVVSDACLVATSASAPEIFRISNLPITSSGFLKVTETLNVEGFENLFAAGDCCEFMAKSLPKAGVFAVREGPIVAQNILNLLQASTHKEKYKPQKEFLKILVSGDKEAIATYRNFAIRGRIAWLLKDYIDRKFMRQFQ